LTQTRRHSFIASLLGIRHVVLAVNKMDLVSFDEDKFRDIEAAYAELCTQFSFKSVTPIPLSALQGDNVINRSRQTPWYQGPTLLGFLETVDLTHEQQRLFVSLFNGSTDRMLISGGSRAPLPREQLSKAKRFEHCHQDK